MLSVSTRIVSTILGLDGVLASGQNPFFPTHSPSVNCGKTVVYNELGDGAVQKADKCVASASTLGNRFMLRHSGILRFFVNQPLLLVNRFGDVFWLGLGNVTRSHFLTELASLAAF